MYYLIFIFLMIYLHNYNIENLTIGDFYNTDCSAKNDFCINYLDMCEDKDTKTGACNICVNNFFKNICDDHNIVSNYCRTKSHCDDVLSLCDSDNCNDICHNKNRDIMSTVCRDHNYIENYFNRGCTFDKN